MSKLESNFRQSIIIKTLRKKPSTYEEILEVLRQQRDYNLECSLRTFQRDVKDIASFYDVEITYNRSLRVYEITDDQMGTHEERLMETFDLLNALNYTEKHAQKMYLEKRKPLGTQHLHGLLHAIDQRLEVTFMHEKFWEPQAGKQQRRVQPIALKEARFRWYLIARDTKDQKIKSFGLDRITELHIREQTFLPPEGYSVDTDFEHCLGIINDKHKKPEKILLALTPIQSGYIQSLPLHPSQRVVSETDTETVIELYIRPTYDFVMELLAMGAEVKVLSPSSLEQELREKLHKALELYH